jgi:hypothetical protein
MLGWAAAAALLAFLYARRLFGDRVAARADAAGLTVHSVFGDHVYAAEHIAALELRRPAGRGIVQIVPVKGRGKQRGLTLNSLVEDEDEVAGWIAAVDPVQGRG